MDQIHNKPLVAFLSRSKSERSYENTTGPEITPCTRSATSTLNDEKGPLGLTTLYDPPSSTTPVADIVFIHGLGGGSRKTWSYSPDPKHYWPQAWLSTDKEFCDVRVHTFGYRADWSQRRESILDIAAFAQSLLNALRNHPGVRRSQTRIILVGHSMGGCVAKKTCILAREDPSAANIAERIHSIFFLATPHRGSDMASLLDGVLSASLGIWGKKPFVMDLGPNSAALASINDAFRHIAPNLRLWSFYETLPTSTLGLSRMVVDKHSATLGYHNEQIAPMDANHRQACKFRSPSEPNYQMLRNALTTAIEEARGIVTASNPTGSLQSGGTFADSQQFRNQSSVLRSWLGVHNSNEESLVKLQLLKQPGTCQWFTQKPCFSSWIEGSGPQVLWLLGRPGIGKSVLSSHVTECLQAASIHCSYFFFQANESSNSDLATCLRSLALQMALQDKVVRDLLLRLIDEDLCWDKLNEGSVWRQVFKGGILESPSLSSHAWVIDGVDECASFRSLFSQRILSTLPPGLRVFGTSRGLDEIGRGLAGLGPNKVVVDAFSEFDTYPDMRLYITTQLNELGRPEEPEARQHISSEILARSRGSFLWVSLVLQELRRCWTEEAMRTALQEIPTDLFEMYTRMIQSIVADKDKMMLAPSIFTWVALSIRPLTVDELCDAVELSSGQRLQNPAKAIPEICAQLVYINHENKACLIHETVREFLMSEKAPTPLAVNKQTGHTGIGVALLRYLSRGLQKPSHQGHETWPKSRATTARPDKPRSASLGAYAAQNFTLHIYKAAAKSDDLMECLTRFLQRNDALQRHPVLDWIEQIAAEGNLAILTRSAMNLRDYRLRRLKYCAPLNSSVRLLDNWVNDLIRVPAKFNAQLLTCPSSIHHLIPSLCPENSAISSLGYRSSPYLRVTGLSETFWDDCLLTVEARKGLETAVAYGRRIFAVGLSTGVINLYSNTSLQRVQQVNHPERVAMLLFSLDDMYLASCGKKHLALWNAGQGAMIRSFMLQSLPLSLVFDGLEAIFCALQSGFCSRWDISTGNATSNSWEYHLAHDHEEGNPLHTAHLLNKPSRAAFLTLDRESCLVAIGYAHRPVLIWELTSDIVVGDATICQHSSGVHNQGIEAMVFNPHLEIPLLAVSYSDGSLCIFCYASSPEAPQIYHRSDAFAVAMAISPDGRYLATGTAQGTTEVFELEYSPRDGTATLEMIYHYTAALEGPVRGVAFSQDGLRLLNIQPRKTRIWAPAALVRKGPSGIDSTVASLQPYHTDLQAPRQSAYHRIVGGSDITAPLVAHPNGKLVLAGKANGDVMMFEVPTAREIGVAYQHKRGASVNMVAIHTNGTLVASADDAANVLLVQLPSELRSTPQEATVLFRHNFTFIVKNLLFSPLGDKLLVGGQSSQGMLNISTRTVTPIMFPMKVDRPVSSLRPVAFQHPKKLDQFVIVDNDVARLYSWSSCSETTPVSGIQLQRRRSNRDSVSVKELQPLASSSLLGATGTITYHQGREFVIEEVRHIPTSLPDLYLWSAALLDPALTSTAEPEMEPLLGTVKHTIRSVLGVLGRSTLLFLDVNLWICTLDLESGRKCREHDDRKDSITPAESGEATVAHTPEPQIRRHFFALGEWRGARGEINCVVTSKSFSVGDGVDKVFLGEVTLTFAHNDHIVVVQRGLLFSQTITPNVAVDVEAPGRQDPWIVVSGSMRSRTSWNVA
ncbi:hypothetical protein B0T21DRAFT_195625 [Apiosordaria backusii]|uniref:GPI inositol-deacylase n=1 Tax=Apiosordaria backusii TaxID=314023 RepID=A0AA40E8Q5_9PEZI|nr:hypothetical protein B0T21DRAFT_195625 [Apiosordaria backusii]